MSWQRLAKKNPLISKTIHTYQNLKSVSRVDVEQFLLLHAVWPARRLSHRFKDDCEDNHWVRRRTLDFAKKHLEGLDAWKSYEESFFKHTTPEGTFGLVHYYQQLCSNNENAVSLVSQPKIEFSPRPSLRPSQRTTRQDRAAYPETPTRDPKGGGASDSVGETTGLFCGLNLGSGSSGSSVFSSPLSQLEYFSPVTIDINKQYQAIENEQIVNTALILLLNALTLRCEPAKGSEWTLHWQSPRLTSL
ncbi:hypothetical protein NM208_g10400 [Fusarium decemcellulare]|uniref:Uncharacterized protein n=1 Tax=Fusarium decemcellulare TaxID=57161 RepID=A0ACC1RY16_9HYPO|nr:hypothetical protein NM208_g10400 [Fusarium decemcellulare]